MALIIAIIIINAMLVLFKINAKITRGANFCQVVKIIQDTHDIEVITEGNQKWNGAIPNFSKMADIKIIFTSCVDKIVHWAILDISISLDPRAWAIKYLIEASVSWFDLDWVIKGINLNMLISIAIHKKSQLELDKAIIDLVRSVVIAIKLNGLFI